MLPFRHEIVGNARLPAVHGGVLGAFLELTALLRLIDESGTDRVPKPITFSVDYLRSRRPDDDPRPRRHLQARPAHRQRPRRRLAGSPVAAGGGRQRQVPPLTDARMRLDLSGHPLHTRALSVVVGAPADGDAGRSSVELVDLRKRGFTPVGTELQGAGIIHQMGLEARRRPRAAA